MNKTIKFYNKNAELFVNGTVKTDVSALYNMFLPNLKEGSSILDLGCGSGRDSKYFIDSGYNVTAIDGSKELCSIASKYIGKEVDCILFEDIDYNEKFDGIWACASLLHTKKDKLIDVFSIVSKSLKYSGTLYVSFKYGKFCGERNGRYFTDLDENELKLIIDEISSLEIVETNITYDARPDRKDEKWLNAILKKIK